MLITFNFSYLENFFVVFYLSFNFILAPGASAPDETNIYITCRCINSVLVYVLTKGQGGAILPMEDTNPQELE